MKQFYAVVHKDEGSAYGVHFPDLPGCFSAADSLEDVLPNAMEALALYFEGEKEVEPGSIEAVRVAAAADLAEGAFLLAVPRFSASTKVERVNISLERGALAAIDNAARLRNMSRSAFLTEAARNEISGAH